MKYLKPACLSFGLSIIVLGIFVFASTVPAIGRLIPDNSGWIFWIFVVGGIGFGIHAVLKGVTKGEKALGAAGFVISLGIIVFFIYMLFRLASVSKDF